MGKRIAVLIGLSTVCAAQAQYAVEILHSGLVPAANSYGAGAGGGQQVGHTNQLLFGPSHALMWSGTAKSLVDLHPAGWDASFAVATDGDRQVGWRERHSGAVGSFATMWSGSSKGWVDLHNAAYDETHANGISGDMQVGFGFIENAGTRAVMWRDTAASIASLHPEHLERSWGWATDGTQQVGFAGNLSTGRHAALWAGTAKGYVDLHPNGYEISEAMGVDGGQQAGWASYGGRAHAIVWSGSAASYVDLNPGPNEEWGSRAFATNGFIQVGLAAGVHTAAQAHAALWAGSPESFINLHELLPVEYSGVGAHSQANGIDEFGNIVGWATHVPTGANHAVLWTPVPEPSTSAALGLLTLFSILMRGTLRRARIM